MQLHSPRPYLVKTALRSLKGGYVRDLGHIGIFVFVVQRHRALHTYSLLLLLYKQSLVTHLRSNTTLVKATQRETQGTSVAAATFF